MSLGDWTVCVGFNCCFLSHTGLLELHGAQDSIEKLQQFNKWLEKLDPAGSHPPKSESSTVPEIRSVFCFVSSQIQDFILNAFQTVI